MPFRVIPDQTFWYQSIGGGTSFNALVGGESLSSLRCPYASEGQNAAPSQILCILVKPLRKYGLFRFSRWRLSTILDFKKLEILTARTLRGARVRHHAKFCADRLNRCGDMAVFSFSRWRPSAILDF